MATDNMSNNTLVYPIPEFVNAPEKGGQERAYFQFLHPDCGGPGFIIWGGQEVQGTKRCLPGGKAFGQARRDPGE